MSEWLADDAQTRRVVRQITNTLWFFRKVLLYGQNCILVSSLKVRGSEIEGRGKHTL